MSLIPPINRLAASWVDNADAWTTAVRTGAIPSRRAGTDAAILDAVLQALADQRTQTPRRDGNRKDEPVPTPRVLDVGCGEGWLARRLAADGYDVLGIDASKPLIDAARAASPVGSPQYAVATYASLPELASSLGAPFSLAVCNFALLDDDVSGALGAIRSVLQRGGTLLIQTVHPLAALEPSAYVDGWREETFGAFGTAFPASMPWYFRTLGSWVAALTNGGFTLHDLREPRIEGASTPLSMVLTAQATS